MSTIFLYVVLYYILNKMFSKACEYGIRACVYIMNQTLQNNKVSLKDVANAIESPEAYTSKILQQLVKSKIILSEKGPTGGFSIQPNELDTLKLSSIVNVIDGENIYLGCGLGLKQCNELNPCPLHNQFKIIRNDLKDMLQNTSIKSLALKLEQGGTFLKS